MIYSKTRTTALIVCCLLIFNAWAHKAVQMQVTAQKTEPMNLLIGLVGEPKDQLASVAQVIKQDLSYEQQFAITLLYFHNEPSKKTIKQLHKQGYDLALFINAAQSHSLISGFEWRLYDTVQNAMLAGKRCGLHMQGFDACGHAIADASWYVLTGQPGFFSTKIAFCKDVPLSKGKVVKHICIADYDGSHEQIIVNVPTINIAPRWNGEQQKPLLFYSEYTNTNVRLMTVTMDRKRKIASNFDGINMLPTFSSDGSKMVYCASRGDGSCQLYYYKRGTFKRLTLNDGNNISPSISSDGSVIYFCSDFQTGKPLIYRYLVDTGELVAITYDGYCTSPSYCERRSQVAYTKMINGIMQIMVYDEKTKKHTQLTADEGNKEECSWSACGNYLVFSIEKQNKSRIVTLNMITQQRRYITCAQENCSYPNWSPAYAFYPVVTATS